ncbi:MAG: type II secretion system minor pseudopilin GspH [Woeseiaceae bacterium]|nr:type II secretion system minor pseudopilin GspH [Woeseiaceae bacterium]
MIRRHHRGFTLIEILVVVMIIATVLSVAVLSVRIVDDDRELRNEARRLGSLISAIQEEASMQGRDFGLEFMTASYRFVEYDAFSGQWIEIVDDDLFRLRELPEEVEFELYLEGQRIVLEAEAVEIEEPKEDDDPFTRASNTYTPHVFLFSSGDVTPFELSLTRLPTRATIPMQSDFLGTISIGENED